MAEAEIKIEAVTVVLRGNFNPVIFQPRWFSAQKLIAESVVDTAEVQIIHAQVCAFSVDSFEVQVTEDRFMVSTLDAASFDRVRDLALGTFSVLSHTPLHRMGLNYTAHLQAQSEEAWHRIGHTLAPKQFWEPVLDKPGMASLTIQAERPDKYKGHIKVKVEPSEQVRPAGVLVDINDHFDSGLTEVGALWPEMRTILEKEWGPSRARATAIVDHVRGKV